MSNGSSFGEIFIKEFVVGFGFLSGVFVNIGVDPENLVIETILKSLAQINPNMVYFEALFAILGAVFLILTIWGAYTMGGGIGLIAVFLAFLGGVFITTQFGWILLIVAVLIGLFIGELN